MPSQNLWVSENFVDSERNCSYGQTDPYETYHSTVKSLFKGLQREYGRCIGCTYIDGTDQKEHKVGWIFEKRVQYDDCKQTFLRNVWVTIHSAPDTVKRERHYKYLA